MIKILNAKNIKDDDILNRTSAVYPEVEKAVREIIGRVVREGDRALRELTLKFDGADVDCFEVSPEETERAFAETDAEFIDILRSAAANISEFHSMQKRTGFEIQKDGILLGQRFLPVDRAGIYVPGGTASYPSTVLMNAIPAKIAGVGEVIMVTPPDKKGNIKKEILCAAKIAGVDRIFKCGGAQAIAALAYGTETVPAVDKIVGPGNIYVATAKKEVFGKTGIDMIAGPSEILIIADGTADAEYLAADMLSQAEHDRLASAVLIVTDRNLGLKTAEELESQLSALPRASIAAAAIRDNSKIIIAQSTEQAAEISNRIAPEHLELMVDKPEKLLEKIRNAGSVFLGKYSPEPLGDYFAGPNHTLPTSGTARFASPLSVDDFIKRSSYIRYGKEALSAVGNQIMAFAAREGLDAHAAAIKKRLK